MISVLKRWRSAQRRYIRQEHLGPVGRLGAAGAGADRQDRRAARRTRPRTAAAVALAPEVALERVGRRARARPRARRRPTPRRARAASRSSSARSRRPRQWLDLGAQAVGLAEDLLGGRAGRPRSPGSWVSASSSATRASLAVEVKDAPRSTGSARPGRGWRARPPSSGRLEVLEQDRTELDQPQGGLAPGDDGVHAGTVAVVGTDAAVAVAVERGGVAAGPAIALAGDEIDERRFLGLLHDSLSSGAGGRAGRHRVENCRKGHPRADPIRRIGPVYRDKLADAKREKSAYRARISAVQRDSPKRLRRAPRRSSK